MCTSCVQYIWLSSTYNFQFYLYILGDSAAPAVQSAAADLERGLSSGAQDWETDESQWPITKPVEKTEAKIQCSGEATYVNDIPPVQGELQAAFVLTSVANCDIAAVDTAAALVSRLKFNSILYNSCIFSCGATCRIKFF